MIEFSHPYFRGLDIWGFSSEYQHNRRSRRCVGMFLCLPYSLQLNIHVTSVLNFLSLYCISVTPGIFICLGLVVLLEIIIRSYLASFSITFYTIHTPSFFLVFFSFSPSIADLHMEIGRQNSAWTTFTLSVSFFSHLPTNSCRSDVTDN